MNINLIFLIDTSITFLSKSYESIVSSSASSNIIVLCFLWFINIPYNLINESTLFLIIYNPLSSDAFNIYVILSLYLP